MFVAKILMGTVLVVLIHSFASPAYAEVSDQNSDDEDSNVHFSILGLRASPHGSKQFSKLTEAFEHAIEERSLVLIGIEELRVKRDRIRSESDINRVSKLREQARSSFLAFQFDEAINSYKQARQILLRQYSDLLNDRELTEVDLEIAGVLLDRGLREEALPFVIEALSTTPDFDPQLENYSQRVLDEWTAITQADELPDGVELPTPSHGHILDCSEDLGVPYVITGEFEAQENSFRFNIDLLSTEQGESIGEIEVTLDESQPWNIVLGEALDELFSQVIESSEPLPLTNPIGRVLVLSEPAGAHISVDGRVSDYMTPATLFFMPGTYLLGLSLDGHIGTERQIVVHPEQTTPIEVNLEAIPKRRWWIWTIVGLVVAGVSAGVISWAVLASKDGTDLRVEFQD